MNIHTGEAFPQFNLKNQDNQTRTLKDYAGKWLVLYVYPKDDTPGCTIQGKAFTAQKAQFEKLGVTVVGLSEDDVNSHRAFCDKFSFTVELLADPQMQLLKTLGVTQSEWKGTMYWDRTTFVIDPQGKLQKIYEDVQAEGHEAMLLADLQALKNSR